MTTITIKIAEFDRLVDVLNTLSKHLEHKGALESSVEWMKTEDVLEVLGITRKTLYLKRIRGELGFSKIGRRLYYRRSDVYGLLQGKYEPDFQQQTKEENNGIQRL